MAKRDLPEVNAGSMADIAFLLLIFFLVTTTIETDSGIDRKLPPIEETEPPIIKKRNIFPVLINKDNQLFVNDQVMEIKDLRQAAIDFLDNGGGVNEKGEKCDYCEGKKDTESSDHPSKAIISVKNNRETTYETFIAVQNELVAAYNFLRNRESRKLYNEDFTAMNARYSDPKTDDAIKKSLKPKVEKIKDLYPLKLSEAETESN